MRTPHLVLVGLAAALACGAKPAPQKTETAAKTERISSLQLVQAQPNPPPQQLPVGGNGVPTLAPLIEQVRPTVVGVTTTLAITETQQRSPELEEFWRRFFGGEPPPFHGGPDGGGGGTGMGSGVIIDPRGVVLTNNHVVEGAEEVTVRTADEKDYKAKVLGTDPETDLAVLQLQGVKGQMPAARLGSSDAMRVGDFVVAIGNPFGLDLTVTSGIISAKARVIGAGPYDDFLQTDAAINPGNSGGPLFDLNGNVVGINTAIVAVGAGIGFAVPIDLAKALLPQLVQQGRVVRGYLGVGIQDLTPELAAALGIQGRKGALVSTIEPGGPAAKSDLKPGDAIVSFQGQPIESHADLTRRVAQLPPKTKVELGILREGKQRKVTLQLGERPSQRPSGMPEEKSEEAGSLGLRLQAIPPELRGELGTDKGALVTDVAPGSRAGRAGLQPGDVVVEANRQAVAAPQDLVQAVRKAGRGQLLLRILRQGGAVFVVIPPER